jgi:crotonobetainyl-CoA:carnitine CoA-transferase CaiB-like acyl-CoA transferase
VAGLFAATGILAAVRHRDRTGEGQRVEIDLLSALLAGLVNQAQAYTGAGVVAERMGNAHPSVAPYEVFAAADGDIVLAVGNDRQFGELCAIAAVPDLAADPRFATNGDRVEHRAELREALEAALARRPRQEWVELFTAAGVPAGNVNDIGQAFALAESLGLEPIASIERDGAEPFRTARNPIRLSRTPARYDTAPPPLEPR